MLLDTCYKTIRYTLYTLALATVLVLMTPTFIHAAEIVETSESGVCSIDPEVECSEEDSTTEGTIAESEVSDEKIVYFFYGEECARCEEEEAFLDELQVLHPEIKIERYEVWHDEKNLEFFKEFAEGKGFGATVVPTTIISDQYFIGYASRELSGTQIEKAIYDLYEIDAEVGERAITIPFYGKVEIASLSLPIITIVLGLIDGFNVCAMWALVALVTILIATHDMGKIRLIGATFLISSWIIYYIFMAIYLNTFALLAAISIIRIIIGLLAIFAGVWYLREFARYDPTTCKVTNSKQQTTIITKMRDLTKVKSFWLLIAGVIALAFSVNLIEMVCSIGLPAVFSQILVLSDIPKWQSYLYLALYNTLYMLDDVVVFIVAAATMNYVSINHKYDRWTKLVGGVLVLALGIILIFRPELLSF